LFELFKAVIFGLINIKKFVGSVIYLFMDIAVEC